MRDDDELDDNIPPMVPERDDVSTHVSNKRARQQEIVRPGPGYYSKSVKVSSWPVRILLTLLVLAAMGGGYGAYYFWDLYQTDLRQSNLRISDLEGRLALMGQSAEETDNSLMEDINQTIEQYDLLWANWRNNNRQFEDIESEIARLKLANEGQDEIANNTSQQLAQTQEALGQANTRLNNLGNEVENLGQSMASLNSSVNELASMRNEVESLRQSLNSGDSTVLGLVGRLEYMEQSMESVNAHRLQVNESLFRLQENVESLQRQMSSPGN
jgi:chromosome segregation ATPase